MSLREPLIINNTSSNQSLNSEDHLAIYDEDDVWSNDVDVSSPLFSLGAPPPPRFPSLLFIPSIPTIICFLLFTSFTICLIWVKPISKPILDFFGISVCQLVEVGSLPIISIIFTYIHIYVALFLVFYPLKYVGCLRIPGTNVGLGWMGIVPFKAKEMAKMAVDLMTKKLIDIEEIFRLIKPSDVRDKLAVSLQQSCAPLIDELGHKYANNIWSALPKDVKEDLIYKFSKSTPDVVVAYLEELQQPGVLKECMDVEHLVTEKLMHDKDLLNQIFIRCGYKELSFIRDCGAWLGGFFGVIQAIIYIFYDDHWVLPVAGLIVGCITNWLALTIIFSPTDPVYIPIPWPKCLAFGCCKRKTKLYNAVSYEHVHRKSCGSSLGLAEITLHGLFLARQENVAKEYGVVAAEHLLNARSVVQSLFTGPHKQVIFDKMVKHINGHVDKMIADITATTFPFRGKLTSLLTPELLLGETTMYNIRNDILTYSMQNLPHWLSNNEILVLFDQSLDAQNVLAEKLNSIPSIEFVSMLRPVFQQDEWKLVLMGGLLGVVIGLFQTYFINTGC
jgi:uncharacterized membrane protein YheB (UPF0754 family)